MPDSDAYIPIHVREAIKALRDRVDELIERLRKLEGDQSPVKPAEKAKQAS